MYKMNEKHRVNKPIERAIEEIRATRMTSDEREILRDKFARMTTEKNAAGTPAASKLESPYKFYRLWDNAERNWPATISAVIILLLALGGGSVALAAQGSLPGDKLYAVKVGIIEPVVGAFRGTGETLAMWQASLVSARLSEVETLASEGRLNDEKLAKIEVLLDKHTAAFSEARGRVERNESSEKAKGIGEGLKASIVGHVNILNQITVAASTTATSSRSRENAQAASLMKAKAEAHTKDVESSWSLPSPVVPTSGVPELIKNNTDNIGAPDLIDQNPPTIDKKDKKELKVL